MKVETILTDADRLTEKENDFFNSEIVGRMSQLIDEIKPEIQAGKYNLLIGDDFSGRLPALIIHKVITEYNRRSDLPKIKTVLFQKTKNSTSSINYRRTIKKLKRQIEEQNINSGHALFVTEYLNQGKTATMVYESIKSLNMTLDVLTLESQDSKAYYVTRIPFCRVFVPIPFRKDYHFLVDKIELLGFPNFDEQRSREDALAQAKQSKRDVNTIAEILLKIHFGISLT